jgi:hypothetical protein
VISSAVISECGVYRYHLQRIWGDGPRFCWIMLNPSTADADQDDPTIRRVIGFSKSWGAGGIDVVNLFALRATNPVALKAHPDPVGIFRNDECILRIAAHPCVTQIIAAWGRGGELNGRDKQVLKMLRDYTVHQVGEWKFPRHPLYLKADLQPEPTPKEQK